MNIVVYGDSISWGIIPGSRSRLPFLKRWTGVLQYSLGNEYRVVEECLNGRTTSFEDVNRPARNGLEHIQMIIESHSPIDLVIVMLGINDFQDAVGVGSIESAQGLRALIDRIKSLSPEPMTCPPKILVIIPPEIRKPLGVMAEKFSGYERGNNSESNYVSALKDADVHILEASKYVALSAVDGVHMDEAEHSILGKTVAIAVREIDSGMFSRSYLADVKS